MSDKGLLTVRFLLRVVLGVVLVVEVIIGLGVLLQALAANADAGFTEWVYRNQDRLMTPFEGIFEDTTLGDSDGVLDVSGLFALAVYGSLLIPLGMTLGWVRRTQFLHTARHAREADDARQARLLGGEPEDVSAEAPSGGRFQALVDRVRGRKPSPPTDSDTDWY